MSQLEWPVIIHELGSRICQPFRLIRRKKAFAKQRLDQSMLRIRPRHRARRRSPQRHKRRGRGFLGVSSAPEPSASACRVRARPGSVYGCMARHSFSGILGVLYPLVSDYGELSDAYKQEGAKKQNSNARLLDIVKHRPFDPALDRNAPDQYRHLSWPPSSFS